MKLQKSSTHKKLPNQNQYTIHTQVYGAAEDGLADVEDVDGLEGEMDVEGEAEPGGMWNSSKQFRVSLRQRAT